MNCFYLQNVFFEIFNNCIMFLKLHVFKIIFKIVFSSEPAKITPETIPLSWKFWQKRRYILVFLSFFGFFNAYSLRVNLSVGIVAMTEVRTVHYANGTVGHVSRRYTILKIRYHTACIKFSRNTYI